MSENNEQLSVNGEVRSQSSDLSPQEDIPQEEDPQSSSPAPQASQKTQGVRPPRAAQAQVLHGAAGRAARSGRRNDVHEYMRLRRNYV